MTSVAVAAVLGSAWEGQRKLMDLFVCHFGRLVVVDLVEVKLGFVICG